MGRYYTGDIEGKFVFGIQSSDAADRFGAHKPALKIYFDLYKIEDDAPLSFYSYIEQAGLPELTEEQCFEYYDYALGRKILNCIQETGSCSFDAEL